MEEVTRNVDMFEFVTISEHFDATCGTFAETSSADWFAKEGSGKRLTRNFGVIGIKFRQQLAIGQNTDVTCEAFGTFAEAPSADWSAKEGCGKLLTRNFGTKGSKDR